MPILRCSDYINSKTLVAFIFFHKKAAHTIVTTKKYTKVCMCYQNKHVFISIVGYYKTAEYTNIVFKVIFR